MIFLMRHGRVELQKDCRWKGSEMAELLATYDATPIEPPSSTFAAPPSIRFVVCSDMSRSQRSASAAFKRADRSDPMFREAALPVLPRLPLRYRASTLITITRGLWLLGFSAGCESRREFVRRSETATDRLVTLHKTEADILLVGHGLINRRIASSLRDRGWSGPRWPSSGHWQITPYAPPLGV